MFQIEKDVPLKNSDNCEFIKSLEIGDSFVDDKHQLPTARSLWSQAAKRCGLKVVTRNTEQGLRVWRVA